MDVTRRYLGKMGLAAWPATGVLAAPNSKFGGVQIGIIAPYSFRRTAGDAKSILEAMIKLGISAVEMQSPPLEAYAGAPSQSRGRPPRSRGSRRREPTPEERAARKARAAELAAWRTSASMNKFRELRRMYNDAGVSFYGFKLALNATMPDSEYDYTFNVAKALGANHVTMELPGDASLTQRIGEAARKHQIYVAYHNHTQVNSESWDTALAQSLYNGINLDVGHFTAAISQSPIPFIRKHHERIHSMHLKDRKYQTDGGENVPWGRGDTPLVEVLRLMKSEGYEFPATIELEYPVPEGSNVMTELARCVRFCKDALTGSST